MSWIIGVNGGASPFEGGGRFGSIAMDDHNVLSMPSSDGLNVIIKQFGTLIDQEDAIAQLFCLMQHVGGEDNRAPLFVKSLNYFGYEGCINGI